MDYLLDAIVTEMILPWAGEMLAGACVSEGLALSDVDVWEHPAGPLDTLQIV